MLTSNPFYILNVPMAAGRRAIAAKADEQSLIMGTDVCENAMTVLTNPAKRLQAELDWFPGTDESLVKEIRDAAGSGRSIAAAAVSGLSGIAKVNAAVYNFELALSGGGGISGDDAADAVMEIDRSLIDSRLEDLRRDINDCRAQAGITPAELSGLRDAWREKKDQVADRIADMMADVDRNEYVIFANRLSEQIADGDFSELLLALIDRYEVDMQPVITEQTSILYKAMNRLTWRAVFFFDIGSKLTGFLLKLGEWLGFVRPMMTAAKSRGTENEYVTKCALGIRELTRIAIKRQEYHTAYKVDTEMINLFSDSPSVRKEYQEELERVKRWMGNKGLEFYRDYSKDMNKFMIVCRAILIIMVIVTAIAFLS